MKVFRNLPFLLAALLIVGCSGKPTQQSAVSNAVPSSPPFVVDPATAGTVTGTIRFAGKIPTPRLIDMSEEPACVAAHPGKAHDESLVVGRHGALANAFVYISSGLEGKNFQVPSTPVVIDQSGCWFRPRITGIQVGQTLKVINSDPVTHNIHPMAQMNREWNHSQGSGDPPISRRFLKPEIMIRVKCNIHSWMHAFIGVVENPYFAVSQDDGSFEIRNLPPGSYILTAWQEKLGTRQQRITIPARGTTDASFNFLPETSKEN